QAQWSREGRQQQALEGLPIPQGHAEQPAGLLPEGDAQRSSEWRLRLLEIDQPKRGTFLEESEESRARSVSQRRERKDSWKRGGSCLGEQAQQRLSSAHLIERKGMGSQSLSEQMHRSVAHLERIQSVGHSLDQPVYHLQRK